MLEHDQSYDPPQDTGAPDQVESDPAALNSAEDLDEDRLRVDPLEEGMDPPEHWSGVTKHGMTSWEQAHPAPLGERLAEERADVGETAEATDREREERVDDARPDSLDYAENLGIAADFPGGSVPDEIRTPPAPD
ncbi:hypothetical protein [Amycolatopsis thailandensis]|uniref:hypothetical protein n=1 Tax=Amycolatopsis thailandensis TaxID=589330 RepID=UPI0036435A32